MNSKGPGIFRGSFFREYKELEHWNHLRRATRPKRAQMARPSRGTAPPIAVRPSDLRSPCFLCHRLCFDLKPSINKAPSRSREEAEHKQRNAKTEAEPEKIGGGNAAGVIPGCISTLSNIIISVSMMKRE